MVTCNQAFVVVFCFWKEGEREKGEKNLPRGRTMVTPATEGHGRNEEKWMPQDTD